MISSAVIVPEPEDLPSTSPPHKRRPSPDLSNGSFKRQRLDTQISHDSNDATWSPSAKSPTQRKPSLTSKGAAEERKRGQRLFGALLGTLSQSSNTTAQRRRADIEKKQLGKLQQRDEELEEDKRKKREKLDAIRRREQKVWDEQSMRMRHRNLLAEAHFLTTKAEPKLFYKPWELRPEEDAQIKRQIDEAEKAVQNEVVAHNAERETGEAESKVEEVQHPHSSAVPAEKTEPSEQLERQKDAAEDDDDAQLKTEMVGADTTNDEQITTNKSTPQLDPANDVEKVDLAADMGNEETKIQEEEMKKQEEKTSEEHGGEELVEGQEDDVIY